MKELVTPEVVETIKKGSEGLLELAKQGSTTIVNETLNLYIFLGVVGVLKAATVFFI